MKLNEVKRILISRTDSIGDVVLTLPMCSWIKEQYPTAELVYLGRSYTQPVVACFSPVDRFIDWNELEKLPTVEKISFFRELDADVVLHVFPNKEVAALCRKAKIPYRIGTSHRSFHLLTCNYRLNFSRKRSDLHEAQLNFELLKPLGLKVIPSIEGLNGWVNPFQVPHQSEVARSKKRVIIHPKSQGSALEWPLKKYIELALKLANTGVDVFFSGTETEGAMFRSSIPSHELIHDCSGTMDLSTFISFISEADTLIACSTGPLHIAASTGIHAVGLFSPKRPIHPGRWSPIGKHVSVLTFDNDCPTCKKGKSCNCIEDIEVDLVFKTIVDGFDA